MYAFYFSRDPACRVHGVDVDPGRLTIAREILGRVDRPHLSFGRIEAKGGGLYDGSTAFDVALLIDVIELVPDAQATLLQIRHALRPGGYLVVHVPLLPEGRQHGVRAITEASLRDLVANAGFEDIQMRPTFGPVARRLCRLYARLATSPRWTALWYPLLLASSVFVSGEDAPGDCRLVVARSPLEGAA
jgi:SAM-dependent methyltransferase